MKNKSILAVVIALVVTLSACSSSPIKKEVSIPPSNSDGEIYLYGEAHSVDKILDKEFELWSKYYNNKEMRHLFIEHPYYTAAFLNIWMKSDSDEILDAIYADWEGALAQSPNNKGFYQKIKSQCPETIFHGTDLGHQNATTGRRFLIYLQDNGLEDSEQYQLAEEAIKQGEFYYKNGDSAYRENMMTENFIREYDKLGDESIMGIYGAAHTGLDAMTYGNSSVPCMANQLNKYYKDTIYSEDLSQLARNIEALKVDVIQVGEKEYQALYLGKVDLIGFQGYKFREFWCLENTYDDFKDKPKTGGELPYNNYPMIEVEQIFVIDYTKTDNSVERSYFRSDKGYVCEGEPSTVEFTVE